jgi:hypothetical protein
VSWGSVSGWFARDEELGALWRDVMSRSGVRAGRLGGVELRKCETGLEEGPTAPDEPALVALMSRMEGCSAEDDGFVRSLDTAFVMDTFGGTRAT